MIQITTLNNSFTITDDTISYQFPYNSLIVVADELSKNIDFIMSNTYSVILSFPMEDFEEDTKEDIINNIKEKIYK